MNKEKLKHLPINLLLNIGIFGMAFMPMYLLTDNIVLSIFVAFTVYLYTVKVDATLDYLQEQINLNKTENNQIKEEDIDLNKIKIPKGWFVVLVNFDDYAANLESIRSFTVEECDSFDDAL